MKSPTSLIAALVIVALGIFVGRETSWLIGLGGAATVLLILAVVLYEDSHEVRSPARPRKPAPAEGPAPALDVLERIESRLARLESSKPGPSPSTSGDNKELKALQERTLSEVGNVLKALAEQRTSSPPATATRTEGDTKLEELSAALSEAISEISKRDASIDLMAANASRANIQRPLIRIAQILEVTRTLQARVADGKSSAGEALEFLVDDMAAALEDFGVEHLELHPGAKVADLPAGSFAAISVVEATEDAQRGTVKEVRSRAYFISEEGKKPRFIAPAKVILFRG